MFFLILLTFAVKFVLSYLPSFDIDMGTWIAWAHRLAEIGPWKFYSDAVWTQYTPGFLYWLWLLGKAGLANALSIKLPVVIAEVATGVIIWSVLRKVDEKFASLALLFYALNPAIIFDGSVWGQVDGILALFLFLSVYFLTFKEKPILSGLFWGLAFLVKPQSFAILPAIIFILAIKFSARRVVKFVLSSGATIFLLGLPFFPQNPIFGLVQLVFEMSSYYSYTSVFAFNFWSIVVGMWKSDSIIFLGVPLFFWGISLYLASLVLIFFVFRKKREVGYLYLVTALTLFAFFLFPTRVHERYLLPIFPFLLTAAGLLKSKKLTWAFIGVSVLSLANLYHPYAYYSKNYLVSSGLLQFSGNFAPFIGAAFLVLFFGMIFDWRLPEIKMKFPKYSSRFWLFIIVGFALLTRILFLGSPQSEYFDEVYHAFTARQILHGNKMAWEWWNVPPKGFAYEWTHPPLAKLGMVLGMLIFGENSFGWRIPGALLGVGSVYLVYLIAKKLFDDEKIALLSAGVFALDGLPLVMSRIGMNDSYILFFALASIYLFMEQKNLFSAIAFGLALSSKWSALWAIPILGLLYLQRKDNIFRGLKSAALSLRKDVDTASIHPLDFARGFLEAFNKFEKGLLWFIVLVPAVYLAIYVPFFLSGHGWPTFIELQKQMWWYHTRLKATHPYTSTWWEWPFLVRPIYLYTSGYAKGVVANIYAMGNPAVFWGGLAAVVWGIYYAYVNKIKSLGLVIFSYLVFFVPWALSPRIMFLYHYLPSIPFLAIATGYFLKRTPKAIIPFFLIAGILFIYFFPHWTGMTIPQSLDSLYYWFPSWR